MAKKSNIPDECVEITKNPIISLEEKGKKMIFRNRKRKIVSKIKVDDCAIKEGKRCDWLVKNDIDYEHFVELKGNDVVYACEQLKESIIKLSENPKKDAKHSFVIPSRVIPAINTTIQNLKRQFKDKFNSTLIVKNQQCEFEI